MKKNIKFMLLILVLSLLTGCSGKLYTYEKVVNESKKKIAEDIVVENPGSFNRNNGLKAYTGYLERDKNKKITIINVREQLLPFCQNVLCTDFAEVYLVPKFNEFKSKNKYNFNTLYNMEVGTTESELHPRCKNLKITIDCNDETKYLEMIDKYIEYLNEDGIYLNKKGTNRYEVYCKDGKQLYQD